MTTRCSEGPAIHSELASGTRPEYSHLEKTDGQQYLAPMTIPHKQSIQRLSYCSRPTGNDIAGEREGILRQSRTNNGLNGVSGLLWSDGTAYFQILEGTPEAVAYIFDIISHDPRHKDIEIIDHATDASRLFGHWAMADFPFEDEGDPLRRRLLRLRNGASARLTELIDRALA